MSYCVNCGVELGEDVRVCPLCGTPVINPKEEAAPTEPFFPTRQEKIMPVSKKNLALLLTSMFASVAICCGLLNLVLRPDVKWSLYAVGAALMLWIFFVPPLLWRRMPFLLRVFVNLCAVAIYVLLIALASGGLHWYLTLALPILFSGTALTLLVCYLLRDHRHSILTSIVICLIAVGLQGLCMEAFLDLYLYDRWSPGWSLILLAVCFGLCVPLIVVRSVSSLREEARRRFHL